MNNGWVRDYLKEFNMCKYQEINRLHPVLLGDLSALIFRGRGRIPSDWRNANIALVFQKSQKNNLSNYRPASLGLFCVEIIEQVTLEYTYGLMNKMIWSSRHGFLEAKSYLNNLIISYDERTTSTDGGRALDVIWPVKLSTLFPIILLNPFWDVVVWMGGQLDG